ncbi:MAG: 5'/3'-nucleotidase SurE [Acidobacteriota bacterium]|nr:5'/3'-nucleotidase SurE [Acidobacteriota bacterium]
MNLILTNDDGIQAPGLAALEAACRGWSLPLVAAPDRCHSSMSHRVTTATPILVTEAGQNRFQIDGSPADCARIALTELTPGADWLISGINLGANLGVDTYLSGTVAAAREAALLGTPAIAISQYIARGLQPDWPVTVARARNVLQILLAQALAPGEFWNVNLPHLPESAPEPQVLFCLLDPSPLPVSFRRTGSSYRYSGDYHSRTRLPGHDVALCFAGAITVTRMAITGGSHTGCNHVSGIL